MVVQRPFIAIVFICFSSHYVTQATMFICCENQVEDNCIRQQSVQEIQAIKEKADTFPMAHVINQYRKDKTISDQQAALYERELKRYLALCAIFRDKSLVMGSEIIDTLWHTFILSTQAYADFCNQVAGTFLHHNNDISHDNETASQERYCEFLHCYKDTFGEVAPATIWPQ